jgi:hypothetical protein
MATLTTLGGAAISFRLGVIDAIADHNDTTGEAVTCIYGIPPAMLTITEPVHAFMQRLAITPEFAQLTRPNGRPVWIRGSSAISIRPPVPGEFPPALRVNAVVWAGSLTQAVRETPAQALAALNAHGGGL